MPPIEVTHYRVCAWAPAADRRLRARLAAAPLDVAAAEVAALDLPAAASWHVVGAAATNTAGRISKGERLRAVIPAPPGTGGGDRPIGRSTSTDPSPPVFVCIQTMTRFFPGDARVARAAPPRLAAPSGLTALPADIAAPDCTSAVTLQWRDAPPGSGGVPEHLAVTHYEVTRCNKLDPNLKAPGFKGST